MMKKTLLALSLIASFGTAMAADLPDVKILATGGTIAGTAASSTQMTGYKAGDLAIQTLIDAVPAMKEIADVSGEQIVNIGSQNMTDEILLKLAKRCNELLADPKVKGIVITHGTDTLEETAYFLNLVVKSDKPVVLVGSMRPATAMSADGPINLVNAVALAADKDAKSKGVMVLMNDQISSAFGVTKTNTTNVATFKCPDTGYMGYMQNNRPYFVSQPIKRHTVGSEFDVKSLKTLPWVEVNFTTLGQDGRLIDAMVRLGAKGIVNAGLGHANVPDAVMDSLVKAKKAGVVVVVASRVGSGLVTPMGKFSQEGFVSAMMHNPQKARILLMLALTRTHDPDEIQRIFDNY